MAKVDITTAGHTVIIEADGADIEAVAALALRIWQATRDPKLDRGYGVTGLQIEKADGLYYTAYDADLGHKSSTTNGD